MGGFELRYPRAATPAPLVLEPHRIPVLGCLVPVMGTGYLGV